jgi:hypothetical protein
VSFEFQQIFGSQTNAPAKPTSTAVAPAALFNRLQQTISRLHAIKTATYGNSWKRRGEILGIMANIARKVDRLGVTDGEVGKVYVAVAQGKKTLVDSETALDTAVDLLVYCLKYRTYLIDEGVADPPENYAGSTPLSDNTDGLDAVLAEAFDLQKTPIDGLAKALEPPAGLTAENLRLNRKIDVVTVAGLTEMAFAALEGIVIPAAASASPVLNQAKATALAELITNARNLVVAVAVACPDMVTALQRQVGLDHVEVEQS